MAVHFNIGMVSHVANKIKRVIHSKYLRKHSLEKETIYDKNWKIRHIFSTNLI